MITGERAGVAGRVPFLVAEGLTQTFGATVALVRVDLAAAEGSVLAVLGPNRRGKTTTVRIFATLLRPGSGRALVGGHDVVTEAAAVRAMIGLAGQYAAVDPFLTGGENLELVAGLRHLPPEQYRREVDLLLERLGLAGAAGRLVRTYWRSDATGAGRPRHPGLTTQQEESIPPVGPDASGPAPRWPGGAWHD